MNVGSHAPRFDSERAVLVERAAIDVMFLETDDEPAAIGVAWKALESTVGSLRGRRFLGTFWPGGRYRASAQMWPQDDPASHGLVRGVVSGGTYLRVRLRGEPPGLFDRVVAAFATLQTDAARDGSRPCIEWYRRHDEVDALVPVTTP